MKKDLKPDRYEWGHIYQLTDLPEQTITELTDGILRTRTGVEQFGPHRAVVVSTNRRFNDVQSRGLIIVPMTSGEIRDGDPKWRVVQPTWVRVRHKGQLAYILCEQIRYVDRGRCGKHLGELVELDRRQLREKLSWLLSQNDLETAR